MNRNLLEDAVREQLPLKRWEHTLGVTEAAIQLAQQYGVDPQKAQMAALLHDYCKAWPVKEQEKVMIDHNLSNDLLQYDKELWHAPVAAFIVQRDLGIDDEAVLDAIRYHTSGRETMTMLDKVVCLADYIEPGRDFPGVHNIRAIAKHSLEKALIAGFDSTISFLLSKGKKVYPLTVMARNALIDAINTNELH